MNSSGSCCSIQSLAAALGHQLKLTLEAKDKETTTDIRRIAGQGLKRADLSKRFRLLGVKVGHLIHERDAALATRKPDAKLSGETLDLVLAF